MPDPHPDEWTINRLAQELSLDRRTVTKRLAEVPPARVHRKQRSWRLADAVRALFGHPTLVAEAELRHRSLIAATEKAELAVKVRRDELVDRAKARRAVFARARADRDMHMAWVMRTVPVIAAEIGVDEHKLFAALDAAMREHLQMLAATPLEAPIDA